MDLTDFSEAPLTEPPPIALQRQDVRVDYYSFDQRPLSDACWSLQTGPDGRAYIACCTEHTGGESATVVRYDRDHDQLEYLFDVDEVTGERRDNGRATQCKIHYSFAPDASRDLLYAATHLSAPPKGEDHYNPFAAWHDEQRAFRGAFLVALNTRHDRVEEARLMIPKEGCRCLALDAERQRLYALTYPRDHFVWYDLQRDELHDLGRLGSVNSQTIFTDDAGRAYTFNDRGRMVRFDPETDRLELLEHEYPHARCQSAWHGVLYDAVRDPNSDAIYMVPWKDRPRLARYWPNDGPTGRVEDLGLLTQPYAEDRPIGVNYDHVGGLVFADDGGLYYVKSVWPSAGQVNDLTQNHRGEGGLAQLCRFDPTTGEHEEIVSLWNGPGRHHYVSRGACDAAGDLFFGKVLASPSGFYRVSGLGLGGAALRTWG